jgi:hypothetical protein
MRARLLFVPIAGLALSALGACGSSSSSGNGEETKSVDQIVADAAAAFGQQQSVHEDVTFTDAGGVNTGSLDAGQTSARLTITAGGQTQTIIVIGNDAWVGSGGSFTQLPAADAATITYVLPPRQAQCVTKRHGVLSKGDVSTVNGKRVIEVKDDGNAPGASPNSTFIALDGPPLPVQSLQRGPTKPGGDKSCGASDNDTTKSGTTNFDYSRPAPTVTPPPNAATAGGGASSSTDTGSAASSSTSTDTGSGSGSSTGTGSGGSSTDTGMSSSSSSS